MNSYTRGQLQRLAQNRDARRAFVGSVCSKFRPKRSDGNDSDRFAEEMDKTRVTDYCVRVKSRSDDAMM